MENGYTTTIGLAIWKVLKQGITNNYYILGIIITTWKFLKTKCYYLQSVSKIMEKYNDQFDFAKVLFLCNSLSFGFNKEYINI